MHCIWIQMLSTLQLWDNDPQTVMLYGLICLLLTSVSLDKLAKGKILLHTY